MNALKTLSQYAMVLCFGVLLGWFQRGFYEYKDPHHWQQKAFDFGVLVGGNSGVSVCRMVAEEGLCGDPVDLIFKDAKQSSPLLWEMYHK